MTTDTEVTIRELDQTWSSLVEIDSHALQRVVGGVIPGGGGGGATSPAKPQLGRTKRILCGLGMLGCAILGPDRPSPGDIDLGGRVPNPPKGRPPAAAPRIPGPAKLSPMWLHI